MSQPSKLIGYFVHHPVAANLLMLFIVCMGLLSYQGIQRQTFPVSDNNKIIVTATELGASVKEIEENILLKIEQALKPQVGIKRLTSQATPSRGRVEIELEHDQVLAHRLDEIKMKLDAIATFPPAMEPLQIVERAQRQRALSVVLSGPDNPLELRKLGNELKEELLQLEGIAHVDLSAIPDYEVAIELSPLRLREYNLSLSDVVRAIQTQADNVSAGEIKTARGNIYLRLAQRGYQGSALASTPVITGPLGETVQLRDIATIKDGFRETLDAGRFNGEQAVYIMVLAAKEQSLTDVVAQVKAYVDYKRQALPEHINIYEFVDVTFYLQGRLNMMLENLAQGAILVFIVLAVFLRTRLAIWVMLGLPVSMLGAFWLMPLFGITMNLVSLFAFIMVLGIVVDDAIVIGESVCEEVESNGHSPQQVIRGAQKVAMPATFGVLTTIAVFMPFMFSSGPNSGQFIAIAGVCILCLFFSLIESKLILPAHLAATRLPPRPTEHWRNRFNSKLQQLLNNHYAPLLKHCIHYRYAVIVGFMCLLVLAICLIISGLLRFTPVPKVPHDYPSINIQMDHSVSEAHTLAAVEQIETLINRVEQDIRTQTGKPMMDVMYTRIDHLTEAEVVVPLVPEAERPFDTFELARRWREQLPDIPGVKKLTIESDVIDIAEKTDLEYRLFANDAETLYQASRAMIDKLNRISGVHSVYSSLDSAQTEYQIQLKPLAHQLNLSAKDVTRQVGARFYGLEVQRVMREGQEVVFKVRGAQADRQQLSALDHTLITLPNGEQVFFGDVARTVEVPGFSSISREQGYQVATISANVDEQYTSIAHVTEHIESQLLSELTQAHPGLTTQPGVTLQAQRQEQSQVLIFGLVGLLVVYCLLALPLQSYLQPVLVMSVIPFSVVGALWGHYLLGYSLSMMSVFGIVAAAGVVINDSLVMTDVINRHRSAGLDIKTSVIRAGIGRFRAILLTSLTTFLGLVPIMFESSLQAQFVIPTAISLSFSVLFATGVTLIMVPCMYVMLEDIKGVSGSLLRPIRRLLA
ncbi:efflux RND transporter permease subunit [Pseudoalteromonas rubra]|uniref:efflux RND transporter permease subunit n=1 Tax=Pseudoalteromonas rubra TaxID=43658 RepID=UPI000F77BFE0|nr:efflux RND transporter permease subunit [Pseudoalteromonas rubra]